MANNLAPRGLINPVLKTGGEPRTHTVLVGSTYASNFYPGQIVRRRADGRVIHTAATTYKSVLGVCMSYLPNPNGQTKTPKDLEIQVVTDLVNTEWELQLSTAATTGQLHVGANVGILAAAYLNLAHVAATAADGVTRPFAPYMVGGTPTTGDHMFRVIGLVVDGKNEPNSANPRVKVEFNPGYHERFSTQPVPGV